MVYVHFYRRCLIHHNFTLSRNSWKHVFFHAPIVNTLPSFNTTVTLVPGIIKTRLPETSGLESPIPYFCSGLILFQTCHATLPPGESKKCKKIYSSKPSSDDLFISHPIYFLSIARPRIFISRAFIALPFAICSANTGLSLSFLLFRANPRASYVWPLITTLK